MCVRHDGAVDRAPGVDEESPLFAIEAKISDSKQWVFVQAHAIIIDTTAQRRSSPFSTSEPRRACEALSIEF